MATVFFSSELKKFTGEEQVEVKARDYRALIDELVTRFENLDKAQMMEMAISIDGLILVDPLFESIEEESEIHFFYFVTGG